MQRGDQEGDFLQGVARCASGIHAPLLDWFRAHQRDLPWRQTADPYAVWVSEIMLQQTQAATVAPYFERWMTRFPTLPSLAAASEDDVLHAWQGLGYYTRARNLLRGAREVIDRFSGRVPDRVEALLTLPGVGPYTAGAIASIAYNQPAPVVDGNVARVLCRLFALRGDPKQAPLQGLLWDLAAALIPRGEARKFNPALMELGATVCTRTSPRCGPCPLAGTCEARRRGEQAELPETPPRPAITTVRMVAVLVWRGNAVLIQRRGEEASRWAGMWEFPNDEVRDDEDAADVVRRLGRKAVGEDVAPRGRALVVRHSVTRYRITLEAYDCTLPGPSGGSLPPSAAWVPAARLEEYALPAAHRRIARHLTGGSA